jgi:hypothetical protein
MEILETNDIKSQVMGINGEDIVLSPLAEKVIKYKFECKNKEKLNIWDAIDQCKGHGSQARCPVVVFKKNRRKPYVAIPFHKFITLIKAERKKYERKKDILE